MKKRTLHAITKVSSPRSYRKTTCGYSPDPSTATPLTTDFRRTITLVMELSASGMSLGEAADVVRRDNGTITEILVKDDDNETIHTSALTMHTE